MKKQLSTVTLALSIFLFSQGAALAEKAVAVRQVDPPLKVLNYEAEFDTKADKTRVIHTVKYQNTTKGTVVSARFGFIEFNAYGDRIDGFLGYTLEDSTPSEKDKVRFVNEAPHAAFFKRFGSAYLWVDSVRFANGVIWKGDRAQVLEELKKEHPTLTDADILEKKSLVDD